MKSLYKLRANLASTMREHDKLTFNAWQHWLTTRGTRGLILSVNSENFNRDFRDTLKSGQTPFYESHVLENQSLPSNKVDQILGQEFGSILFNAQNIFDSNLFVALSGTLAAGGSYLLNLPLELEPVFQQLVKQQKTDSNIIETIEQVKLSPSLKRLIKFSLDSAGTAIVCKDLIHIPEYNEEAVTVTSDFLSEQEIVINQICRVALGHAKRPLVLIANRGRGKSAALGIAAARLINESTKRIIVTAPNRKNIDSLLKHLNLNLIRNHQHNQNDSKINFVAIDRLIEEMPETDLLMVDEAAAIPVQLLDKLVRNYNRIIFASTSDGYEGNGKGFEIRFQRRLLEAMPQTRFATLSQPFRWSSQDLLEPIIFKSFLLASRLPAITQMPDHDQIKFVVWKNQQLEANENLLQQVFSLLVNAHYQTRPADLEMILANPDLSVAGLVFQDTIIAVALLNREGLIDTSTCQRINAGQMRLKGQLLPQSIIIHSGIESAGSLSFLRVMRIAVHPQIQRKKLGSHLLDAITKQAKEDGSDLIGASFSAENNVVNFWLNNRFQCIRIGSSKDSSSGEFSCEILKALSVAGQDLLSTLTKPFYENLSYKLKGELQELDSPLFADIARNQFEVKCSQENDIKMISAFSKGEKGLSSVDYLLANWLLNCLARKSVLTIIGKENCAFLVDLLLKQCSFENIARQYGVTGKKQIIAQLRALVGKILTIKD